MHWKMPRAYISAKGMGDDTGTGVSVAAEIVAPIYEALRAQRAPQYVAAVQNRTPLPYYVTPISQQQVPYAPLMPQVNITTQAPAARPAFDEADITAYYATHPEKPLLSREFSAKYGINVPREDAKIEAAAAHTTITRANAESYAYDTAVARKEEDDKMKWRKATREWVQSDPDILWRRDLIYRSSIFSDQRQKVARAKEDLKEKFAASRGVRVGRIYDGMTTGERNYWDTRLTDMAILSSGAASDALVERVKGDALQQQIIKAAIAARDHPAFFNGWR